jgi:hypothetical protein
MNPANQKGDMAVPGHVQVVLIGYAFRLFCVLTGFAVAYLGYRLFTLGQSTVRNSGAIKEQEIKAVLGKASLTMKRVSPGVVFVMAGVIIASVAIIRPLLDAPNGMVDDMRPLATIGVVDDYWLHYSAEIGLTQTIDPSLDDDEFVDFEMSNFEGNSVAVT